MSSSSVAVVGAGAWGTALAVHVGSLGERVRLWMRDAELARRAASHRDNPVYLPGVRLPDRVEPTTSLDEALGDASLVIAAVPSQFAREVYATMADRLDDGVCVVATAKGIEHDTFRLPLEVLADELGSDRPAAVLSGPSFAAEVARGRPTAVVVASTRESVAADLQRRLSSRTLRLYTNGDVVGVQLAGALKNVIAIAIGIADSLGLGDNARAGLITRGLAQMRRLTLELGGRPSTLSGLAGLGDLVLTCTGEASRNRRLGRRLGRGERLRDILSTSRSVAEGVATARSAAALAASRGVELPIVDEVRRILDDESDPQAALERLLSRPLTSEEVFEST